MKKKLSYAAAGVDRAAADRLAQSIGRIAAVTASRKVRSRIGGYASLYEVNRSLWLASTTDGVGTKLKLAFRLGRHDTVGIDLVAMSVNDLLCVGADPAFFLDYFATGKLAPATARSVIAGIVEGCRQAGCALVGGETAEMPEFYAKGEYDLAGFAVGLLPRERVLPRGDVKPGDALVALASSGFHSNGFSLLRRLVPEGRRGDALAKKLLTPTRIYVEALRPLLAERAFKGLAHVTGSGFLNVPRISDKVSYELELPGDGAAGEIWEWVREASGLPLSELAQTFNMGVGMVGVVPDRQAYSVVKRLRAAGEKAWVVGHVTKRRRGRPCEVRVRHPEAGAALLKY